MTTAYKCECCGHDFDEHEVANREEPQDRQYGRFAGQEWTGLVCPEPEEDGV